MSLTIKGESGKALDDTARDFDTMRIRGASLRLATLDDDVLEWRASTSDVMAGTAPIPEVGQIVELFDGPTRRFRGHALDPVYSLYGVTVKVVGPWWWMRGENAVSNQTDDSGGTAERPIVRFETGNLSTHFATAIADMVAAGIPLQAGTIASTWSIPTVSFQVSSWADVITRLMEWIADGVAWFDYTGTGHPKLTISRRGGMPTETITIGTTPLDSGSFSFSPRTDLRALGVSVPFMDRHPTTGKPRFQSQSAGTTTGTRSSKIVVVSGPELVDFLPFDDFDSYAYSSAAFSAASVETAAMLLDSQFGPAKAAGLTNELGFAGPSPLVYQGYSTSAGTTLSDRVTIPADTITRIDTGLAASTLGKVLLMSASPPQWFLDQAGAIPVRVSGTWSYRLLLDKYESPYFAGDIIGIEPVPAWVEFLSVASAPSGGWIQQGFYRWSTQVLRGTFSFDTYLLPTSYAGGTSYKPLDYNFLNPPAGLAANLLAAQNWVPWEGLGPLKNKTCPNPQVLGKKWNVAGFIPAAETAGALVGSAELDLMGYDLDVRWGPPARLNYRSLVRQASARPQDVIIKT